MIIYTQIKPKLGKKDRKGGEKMKLTGKITMLMIAVVAIGVFAMPSVMSVGSGQHTFLNRTQVDCNKCHTSSTDGVSNELNQSGYQVYTYNQAGKVAFTGTQQIHKMDGSGTVGTCKSCHALAAVGAGTDHTAVTRQPSCTATCHTIALSELQTTSDPHTRFSTAGNAGCMGCHTKVAVGGSPSYSYSQSTWTNVLGLSIGNTAADSAPLP